MHFLNTFGRLESIQIHCTSRIAKSFIPSTHKDRTSRESESELPFFDSVFRSSQTESATSGLPPTQRSLGSFMRQWYGNKALVLTVKCLNLFTYFVERQFLIRHATCWRRASNNVFLTAISCAINGARSARQDLPRCGECREFASQCWRHNFVCEKAKPWEQSLQRAIRSLCVICTRIGVRGWKALPYQSR